MKHKLIKTENYLLVVDELEIKESRLRYIFDNRQGLNGFIHQVSVVLDSKLCPEIIAHLPLNNAPILEGVPLLPPLEDEVEKLANKWAIDNTDITMESNSALNKGFKGGYNKAKEKYKWTDDDLRKALSESFKASQEGYNITCDEIIQSLQQPKYPVAFECEMVTPYTDGYADDRVRRFYGVPEAITITNSQGQTQLVGTYIYE
jgi:hypothetical protein